jgi:hypothetical protein
MPGAANCSALVKDWKQRPIPVDGDTPAVFLFGR